MYKITFTALGDIAEKDWYGLHGLGAFALSAGQTAARTISNEHWGQLQPVIEKLSQKRVQLTANGARTGKTGPLFTYGVERVPGGRPRVHQIAAALSVLASAPASQPVVLSGENLIPGVAAQHIVNRGLGSQLTLTAARKGHAGNRVVVNVRAASGAGAVTVTPDNLGGATIDVVPAVAGPGANAVAAQMAANAECSRYVSAAGGGTDAVGVRTGLALEGGAGAGVAFLDVRTAVDGSYLRVESIAPGNRSNGINVSVAAPSGGGSVTVTQTDIGIDIEVVPALGAATLDDLAAQLNASDAAAVVSATAVGVGATAVPVTAQSYLYGGSGESPTITVGGAEAVVTGYSDTAITLSVSRADLVASGLQAGEVAQIVILHDYGLLNAGSVAVGQGVFAKAPVRVATAAALPAYTRVGNVITANANGALTVDGVAVAVGNRVLVKDGAAGADNGIFDVTAAGAVGAAYVLTRSADMDDSTDCAPGMEVAVTEGAVNMDSTFRLTNDAVPTLNTTALVFEATPGRVRLKSYANLAALPTGGECQLAYLASGRKTGEGAGAGTGIPVYFADSSWRRFYDDAAATE